MTLLSHSIIAIFLDGKAANMQLRYVYQVALLQFFFFLSFGKCDEDLTTFLLELNQRLQSLCVHLNNEDSNALELSERKLEAFCSIIIAILLAISGLFIWGEISHIGGTSHLSEILFIPVSLHVYFQVVMFSLFTYFFVFISILS